MPRLQHDFLVVALSVAAAQLAIPAGAQPLPACSCTQLPAVVLQGGEIDAYAPPEETAFPGPELQAEVPGTYKNFDDPDANLFFGHTFRGLPKDIVCAQLEIRLRPSAGGSDNDQMYFGASSGPPFFSWSTTLAEQLPGGGSWTVPANPAVLVYDLGSLPATGATPATSLIAKLNAARRLDIFVQDDTEVDYIRLTLRVYPSQLLTAGGADDFALPTEGTLVGAQLFGAYPGVAWKNLDDDTPNRFLGHTFGPITTNVVQGSLETKQKAHADIPDNDTLNLGLNPGPGWAFASRLENLPTPGGSWDDGDPASTLSLDLAALPGSINLLGKINTDDRLDLLIQDDTQGDYLRLRYRSCPPPNRFDGFPFESATSAIFTPIANGGFTVTTNGQPGQGVRTVIGNGEGICIATQFCMGGIGTALDLAVVGTVQQLNQPSNATATLSFLNTGSEVDLSANFPSPFDVFLSTEVWNQGNKVLTYSSPGPNGTVNGVIASLPTSACVKELDFIDTLCFRTLLVAPVAIQLEQGGPLIVGDEIRVCRSIITNVPFRIQAVSLTTPNATSFSILGAAFRAFGFFERALGSPGITADPNGLTVYDLAPTGEDGISAMLGSAISANLALGPIDPAGVAAVGSYLDAEAIGELGGVPGQSLGTLRISKETTDFEVDADFGNISSPTQRIQVLSNGTMLANIGGHTGAAAQVTHWPIDIGKLGGQLECYVIQFPPGGVIEVDDVPYAANELRILAETTAPIGPKSEFQLRAAGLAELRLTGVTAVANLIFQDGFESGDVSAWSSSLP